MDDQTRARIEVTLKSLAYCAPEMQGQVVYEKLVRPYEEEIQAIQLRYESMLFNAGIEEDDERFWPNDYAGEAE